MVVVVVVSVGCDRVTPVLERTKKETHMAMIAVTLGAIVVVVTGSIVT